MDGLPSKICSKCFDLLKIMIKFRIKCLDSDVKLKNEIHRIKQEEPLENANVYMPLLIEEDIKIENITEDESNLSENYSEQPQTSISDFIPIIEKGNNKGTPEPRKFCEMCGKFFNSHKLLDHHMNTHTGLRPFKCRDASCDKMFAALANMRAHFKYAHKADALRFGCDICGGRFKIKTALKYHMSYHYDPQIPCDVCGKLMRNK